MGLNINSLYLDKKTEAEHAAFDFVHNIVEGIIFFYAFIVLLNLNC